jgi:hypothetical protein
VSKCTNRNIKFQKRIKQLYRLYCREEHGTNLYSSFVDAVQVILGAGGEKKKNNGDVPGMHLQIDLIRGWSNSSSDWWEIVTVDPHTTIGLITRTGNQQMVPYQLFTCTV